MLRKDKDSKKDFNPAGVLPSLAPRQKTVTIQPILRIKVSTHLPPAGSKPPDGQTEQDGALTKSCFLSESEHDEMPEMFSLSTSSIVSYPALQITGSEWGGPASSLLQEDLVRNQRLKHQLSQLRLSDFFDVHGGPHFKLLSITFAAKQNRDVGSTFGSTGDLHASVDVSTLQRHMDEMDEMALDERTGMLGSSKAFLAASEARAKDMLMTREKAEALLRKVNDQERLRTADVNQRRLGRLFAEISAFETVLPNDINIKDIMPTDSLEEEENTAKQLTERQNAFLADEKFVEGSQMSWLFTQTEVLLITRCMQRWSNSTQGAHGAVVTAGMDRPTFCRMLLDLELVGEKVPYFWAVCLFDSLALPMRLCPDVEHAAVAPVLHVVNRFRLISVLDVIIRQYFEAKTREDFLQSLKKYAKKLKASDPGDSKRDSLDAQGMKHTEPSRKGQGQGPKKADKDIFNLARDRLISAMLIEPEVLHVVYCFQHQFRILFNCYAPKGHMQFTELWQFCVDFQLTPRFIPEQQLRRAYEAAECFLVLAPRLVRKPPRASKARGKAKDGKGRSKAASSPIPPAPGTERERLHSTDSAVSSTLSENEQHECETVFGANAFVETLCRVAFLYLGFYGSTLQQSTSSYFKVTWLVSYLRRMSCLMLDNPPEVPDPDAASGAAALVTQLPGLWDDFSEEPGGQSLLQPHPGPGNRKPLRRQSRQQSMAPSLKPSKQTRDAALSLKKQKTMSNIREAVKNLGRAALVVKKMAETQQLSGVVPRKLDDSSSEEDIPQPSPSKLTLSNNETKERIAALTTRMAVSFHKPKKQKKTNTNDMPVEELFKVEAGKPAVVNGICQLCGRSREDTRLGNPACRGCSIVDSIHLQAHPFARLLSLDSNPYGNAKVLRPRAKAHTGERLRPAFRLPEVELPRIESQALLD